MIDPRHPDFKDTPAAPGRPSMQYHPAATGVAPQVSIVTPFFNTGGEFVETAHTVFGQSFQQWEWIIVNDGSTDTASLSMLDGYRTLDERIRVIDHAENRGLSAARNTGWRAARSAFIVLLDSDDLLEPTAVEKWYWHLATFPEHAFVKGFGVGFGGQEYLWQRGFHERQAFLDENIVDATSMIRRSVLETIGGFDESTRAGLEDWDLWLHAASEGYWGSTVPEFLNWYRRRAEHTDRWSNLSAPARAAFRDTLRLRYPRLWEQGFPKPAPATEGAYAPMEDAFPAANRLAKPGHRLLMIVPWFAMGGADKFNCDVIGEVRKHGWEVTVASTMEGDHAWLAAFARLTPDVFPLDHFLRLADYPRFLAYLIASREIDTVMVTNSELGYKLVPYLRSRFPSVTFVDYCHMEDDAWNNGGYPRQAVQMQEVFDLNITSSDYLRAWEIHRGGDPSRIAVCTTNIDTELWRPDPSVRARQRAAFGIDDTLPVILFSGRIVAQKQPAVLLEAVRMLDARGVRSLTLVAGDGVDREALEARAASLHLGQALRFLGAVPNDRIRELMLCADILFLPSAWEGIALTVYEAMAAGVVVVGAVVGGQAELVTEGTGILIQRSTPAQEAQEYAAILERLVGDRALRSRLGRAARERVEQHFSLRHMGERMIGLFEHARQLHAVEPRAPVSIGLGRSTALEALESQRNRPNRWWYTGLTDAAEEVIALVKEALARDDHATALAHLRGVRAMFVRAEDKDRVAMIDTRIAEIEGLPAAPSSREDAPLVSVIIPCYGQAAFVTEAMASVLAQTYSRWELIIVNDGSPDDTSRVVRSFIAEHPGYAIRLIEQSNTGLPGARNAGCRAAHGVYLLPLDADDRIAPGFIAACLGALQGSPDAGFAYTHIRRFGAAEGVFALPPFDAHTVVHEDNTIAVCALLRRTMWEEVGGYDESMVDGYEDWDFWVGCIEKGWRGIRIPEPLFEYRIRDTGALKDANTRRMTLIARIIMHHPSLYEESTRTWAEQHLRGESMDRPGNARQYRIVYLIHNIQGVTGGNQTLLHHANALVSLGHEVTIVTYSEPPDWIAVHARIIRVPVSMPLASGVPVADAVIATYFLNAFELEHVSAPVKIYFAQGDQFIFGDTPGAADGPMADQVRRMRDMSAASYRLPGVQVVANSRTLQKKIREQGGQSVEEIIPVCVNGAIFHPIPRTEEHALPRILIVGPDSKGTAFEPLTFKGIGDCRDALMMLLDQGDRFEIVRISNTPPEIFRDVACEFHQAPPDDEKTRLFGTADILVYASHYDSCPRPPLEGMAAGLAVVCTATEGAAEYCIDGENALLVPPARPEELAAAVRALLHDRVLREHVQEGGRRTAAGRPAEREWTTMLSLIARAVPAREPHASSPGHGHRQEGVWQVVIPSDLADGPSYARLVNTAWREAGTGPLCVVRDGVTGTTGWQERLAAALQQNTACAAVAPAILPAGEAPGREERRSYEERAAGRRVALTTLPTRAWMIRAALVAKVGLLDETLASPEAVLDDLAYRVLLAGGLIQAVGECAVTVDAEPAAGAARVNPLPVRGHQGSDPLDRARREVVRACALAAALEEAERHDDAVAVLDEAIARVPESPRLHAERAWLLLRAGAYERVSNLLLPTPDSVKRDPVWLEIAGWAMQGMGETVLARQCADKSLTLDPQCAGALVIKGMLAVDDGDDAAAVEAFHAAITADPSFALASAHLGALLWVTGERTQGSAAIERAFVLDPTHPAILASYRDMVHESGRYPLAVSILRDACRYHPHHRTLAVVYAEVLNGAGEKAAALDVLVQVLAEHGPAPDVLDMALALRAQAGSPVPAPADGVSLCMIVRNEEVTLARCLADAALFVDELVVVDTGSTDRTAQIATACGARVHVTAWEDDYAAARNVALAHARGAWVMSLDADERLSARDLPAFTAMVDRLRRSPAGVVFTTRNYVADPGIAGWRRNDGVYAEEAGSGWIPSDKVRLFPRDPRVAYEHPVHEVVESSLERCGYPIVRTEVPIHHYGRLDGVRTREKAVRYAEIGRRKLAHGALTDVRAVRELAAQEQELGNHGAAIPLWQQVVRCEPTDARAFLGLGVSLAEEREYAAALEALARAMALDPAMPEAPVKHALVAMTQGDVAGAIRTLEEARRATPDYPFAIAAHAAALACRGDIQGAHGSIDDLRRRGIDGRGFFAQVVRDLAGAGQDPLARSLMTVLQSTEGMAVAL